MSDHYPLPKHAAYIWIVGDQIHLGFPPTVGTKGHSVQLPATPLGLGAALDLLKARQKARLDELRIGYKEEPTQYQLDAIIQAMKKGVEYGKPSGPKRDGSDVSLEELGL